MKNFLQNKMTMPTTIDAGIWQQFKEGSQDGLKIIYNQLVPFFYNYGCHLCKDEEMVKDIIQDFFLDIWNKRSRLPEVTYVKTYLTTAFKRKVIDALRKETSLRKKEIENQMNFNFQISTNEFAPFGEKTEDLRSNLAILINCLSKRQREAIFLKFYLGFGNEELAEIMNISTPAVYNIISKSLEVLKVKSKAEQNIAYLK